MPIQIAKSDPQWPATFLKEAEGIRSILGRRALQLHHVGSTSVPGLAAKPIIDIVLVVADSSNEPAYASTLESAGYPLKIREPEWHQHRMFKGPGADINLHVFSQDCPEVIRMLRFRDWLRAHPADRDLYEQTKRALASNNWKATQDYADAKTTVIEQILHRAL